ncbi:MAG: cytochrome c oxidase subunit 2A [Arenicellales bacterium]|nr:cytochrome c oxidase subunit 2A [Arenicellales bacterium]
MTPEEEKELLHSAPKGTLFLLLVFAALMLGGWLAIYLMFLSHGPLN